MTHNARRGYDFERRVADFLLREGAAHVIRSPGSRGPADLYAFYPPDSPLTRHRTRVRLVQCKRRGKLNEQSTARLVELASRIHAEAVLAVPGPKNRGVVLERIPVVL
jgi:Holliday junction resolvase